jgi:hypothetical protein
MAWEETGGGEATLGIELAGHAGTHVYQSSSHSETAHLEPRSSRSLSSCQGGKIQRKYPSRKQIESQSGGRVWWSRRPALRNKERSGANTSVLKATRQLTVGLSVPTEPNLSCGRACMYAERGRVQPASESFHAGSDLIYRRADPGTGK